MLARIKHNGLWLCNPGWHIYCLTVMNQIWYTFLKKMVRFPNRTLYLQNVPTGHGYHSYIVSCSLLYRKVHESKLVSHHVTYSPIPRQYSCFRWPAIESRNSVAHQRAEKEWPVGTFCKYNVLLGNLPLYYRMFPPAIDRQPKLTYIGGGSERWVVGTLSLV